MKEFYLLQPSGTDSVKTKLFFPILPMSLNVLVPLSIYILSSLFFYDYTNKCFTQILMTLLNILSYPVLPLTCCNCLSLHISTGLQCPCSTFQWHHVLHFTCCTCLCTFCRFKTKSFPFSLFPPFSERTSTHVTKRPFSLVPYLFFISYPQWGLIPSAYLLYLSMHVSTGFLRLGCSCVKKYSSAAILCQNRLILREIY